MSTTPMQLPVLFAAEVLPPDLPMAGEPTHSVGGGLGGQAVPILLAALFVVVPLALLLAFSRRRRRKRKPHLPRNPTLAETGGLPPPRQS